MAWVVTDHASKYGTSGSPALSPTATITVGSLVIVGCIERTNTASAPSVGDSGGNTYTKLSQKANGSNLLISLFYSILTTQLTTLSTITYTPVTSTNASALLVISATGNASSSPADASVTASSSGTSSTVGSLASGTPAVANELFVGLAADTNNPNVFTLDSGDGWSAGPDNGGSSGASATDVAGGGGNQVNAGTGTKTLHPTASGTPDWCLMVGGFKPASTTTSTRLRMRMGVGI